MVKKLALPLVLFLSFLLLQIVPPSGLGQAMGSVVQRNAPFMVSLVNAGEGRILVEGSNSVFVRNLVQSEDLNQVMVDILPRIVSEHADSIITLNLKHPLFVPTNYPPIAKAGKGQSVAVGSSITFDASDAHDPDGSIISYRWDFGDGTTSTGEVVTHTYSKTGVYSVLLTVIDDDGAKSSDEVEIEVTRENNPPVIERISAEQKVVALGGSSRINASVFDPDGDTLSYEWSSEAGSILAEGSTITWKAPENKGTYRIALKVEDGYGGVDEKSISVQVIQKLPSPAGEPYITLHGHKTKVLVGEEVIFHLSVVNPITSPGTLKVQLTLRLPSGWSAKGGEFGPPVGGLQTATYNIKKGERPQTIGVHLLANEPFDGSITGYMDYYFIQDSKSKHHEEINQHVKAKPREENPPSEKQPPDKKGGWWERLLDFECSPARQ